MNRFLIVIMLLTALSCSRKNISEKSSAVTSLKSIFNSSIYNADSTGIIFYTLDSTMARNHYEFGVFNVSADSLIYKGQIANGKIAWEGTEYVKCSERTGVYTLENYIKSFFIKLSTGETSTSISKQL